MRCVEGVAEMHIVRCGGGWFANVHTLFTRLLDRIYFLGVVVLSPFRRGHRLDDGSWCCRRKMLFVHVEVFKYALVLVRWSRTVSSQAMIEFWGSADFDADRARCIRENQTRKVHGKSDSVCWHRDSGTI